MNWHLFQQNNPNLSVEDAYQKFRYQEESQLREAVITRARSMGAIPSAIFAHGGSKRRVKGFQMKVADNLVGFGVQAYAYGKAIVNWGDGTSEELEFIEEDGAWIDFEHTYTDGASIHTVTIETTEDNIQELYLGYNNEVIECSDLDNLTAMTGLDLRGNFPNYPAIPNLLEWIYYVGCYSTEAPPVNATLRNLTLRYSNVDSIELNELIVKLDSFGNTNGVLDIMTNNGKTYTPAVKQNIANLDITKSWSVSIEVPFYVEYGKKDIYDKSLMFVYMSLPIQYGQQFEGVSVKLNGELATPAIHSDGAYLYINFDRDILITDSVLVSFDSNIASILSFNSKSLESFTDYALNTADQELPPR